MPVRYQRLREVLWPLGGTILGLVVMPVAIAQYPDFFNKNRWLLPVSVVMVIVLFLTPLLIHENAAKLFRWSRREMGPVVTAVFIVVAFSVIWGLGSQLFRFHVSHLNASLNPSPMATNNPSEKLSPPETPRPKPPKLVQVPSTKLPLEASIFYGNLTIPTSFLTFRCDGYKLSFMSEMVKDSDQMVPLATVHLAIRFPRIIKDYRVNVASGYRQPETSVVYESNLGCHFAQPQSTIPANAHMSFDPASNQFTFFSDSFDDILFVQFLTDDRAKPMLGLAASPPPEIETHGQYQYNSTDPQQDINFTLTTDSDLASVWGSSWLQTDPGSYTVSKIAGSDPETFIIGWPLPQGSGMKGMRATRPLTENELRRELTDKMHLNESDVDSLIQKAKKNPIKIGNPSVH
jgi:hypothetical protein